MPQRNITLSYNQWEVIHKDEKSILKQEKSKSKGGFHLYPNTLKNWKKDMKRHPTISGYHTWSRGDLGGFPHVHHHKLSDYSQNILDMQHYRENDGIPNSCLHYPDRSYTRIFAGWSLCNVYDYRTNTQISYHTTNEQWDEMRFAMGKKMDLEQDKRWFRWDLIDLFKEINEVRNIITFTTEQETIYKTW